MKDNYYCIIMAGGVGTRFWPMAKADRPKQFLDIMGTGESMLQTTFRRMEKICPRKNIIIVTSHGYEDKVRQQIGNLEDYQVLGEPIRRGTAACIAYAASVIEERCKDAEIIVTPSDHAVFGENRYVENMKQALELAAEHDWILTVGAKPTNPNTKYGYIQYREEPTLESAKNVHTVVTFTEKPPVEMARQFIISGEFFWNTGILIWRLDVLKKAFEQYLPGVSNLFFGNEETGQRRLGSLSSDEEVERVYSICESISTDYGIMEKADNVEVMEAGFGWSDVETWDSLYETCTKDSNGNVILGGNVFSYDLKNCVVHISENKSRAVVLEGLDGYIVAADEDTLLVCRRDKEDQLVKYSFDVEMSKLHKEQK
ncbi:MAG: mannose-1-phosphate guanylyltransferase [Bacteroidales bacterium]|nr:mannose-1-phosphate guanylyltransferase [Bacteroidales bacterium]